MTTSIVETAGGTAPRSPQRTPVRAVNRLFRRSRALAASCLVGPAVLWLLVVYVLSLVLLIFASLYTIDDFTFETTDERTLDNLRRAFTQRDVLDVVLRSVLVALAVTAVCLVIALPTAFYIAKVAKPWARRGLIVSCLLPLWAGYLVKG